MTKKEIVRKISEEKGLTQLAVKEIVQMTFDAIVDTLINDPRHRIELRNFGVFEVKKRAARTARNPRTGERVEVPAKYVVTFKPGKEMEAQVLELERAEQEREAADAGTPTPEQTEMSSDRQPPEVRTQYPEQRPQNPPSGSYGGATGYTPNGEFGS